MDWGRRNVTLPSWQPTKIAWRTSSRRCASIARARPRPGARARAPATAAGAACIGWMVAIVAVAALGVGGFFVFREGSGRIFSEDVELGAVTLMSPAQSDVTLVATGYVYARKKANVAPKAAGRLARFFVDEGAKVKEGDMIVRARVGGRAGAAAAGARRHRRGAGQGRARARRSRRRDRRASTARRSCSPSRRARRPRTTTPRRASTPRARC